jgi:wyosine [tRNA(Phe)-imidazoG37] synthetase (radical SAM superfamily)
MSNARNFQHLFGPVPSRRLGRSLGIDVVPRKTCTYNCTYCQLGPTSFQTLQREEYVPVAEVMAEIKDFLANRGDADYLTFSGSGEPTLHSKLGEMIAQTKRLTRIPVAVLTCGALMSDPQVRADLAQADMVLPSLDAALPKTFHDLNRPHGKLCLAEIIHGLKLFRAEYRGPIWLEIMLVKGVNDGAEEVALLRKAIAEIAPDKVQLNTVIRPPVEPEARALSEAELRAIQEALGPPAEIIAAQPHPSRYAIDQGLVPQLLAVLAQHPLTLTEVGEYLQCKHEIIWWLLHALIEEGVVEVRQHFGKKFYVAPQKESF